MHEEDRELLAQIEARRRDKEFMSRVAEIVREDADVLAMLADTGTLTFCMKRGDCGRPNGHLGTCTASPGARTRIFDTEREDEAERHERAAVLGGEQGGLSVAPTMPEFRPRRYGGTQDEETS